MLLVAVTKDKTIAEIQPLYDKGLRDFGESRLQDAEPKMAALPSDINWHFIGTLQSKKVAKVVGKFVLIHSVDSFPLAEMISSAAQKKKTTQDVLLQVNILGEATKHGFSQTELEELFPKLLTLPALVLRGLMTMAPQNNPEAAKICFSKTHELQQALQERYSLPNFTETSMGMSDDYKIALECGATIIRLGRALNTL